MSGHCARTRFIRKGLVLLVVKLALELGVGIFAHKDRSPNLRRRFLPQAAHRKQLDRLFFEKSNRLEFVDCRRGRLPDSRSAEQFMLPQRSRQPYHAHWQNPRASDQRMPGRQDRPRCWTKTSAALCYRMRRHRRAPGRAHVSSRRGSRRLRSPGCRLSIPARPAFLEACEQPVGLRTGIERLKRQAAPGRMGRTGKRPPRGCGDSDRRHSRRPAARVPEDPRPALHLLEM